MINQQELDEAIETISEGGQALGVSCEDVYKCMINNEQLMLTMMEDIHGKNKLVFDGFFAAFNIHAKCMLLEVLQAKQEIDNA